MGNKESFGSERSNARGRREIEAASKNGRRAAIERRTALIAGAGAWSDEQHQDLESQDDVNRYLAEIRQSTNQRISE